MNVSGFFRNTLIAFAVLACLVSNAFTQDTSGQGTSIRLLVTVEARKGSNVPEVTQRDVMVYEGKDRDSVTDWVPAQRMGLELFILLDDSSSSSLGNQLDDIRKFIAVQPENAKIGIAYMQNGTAKVEQSPTTDHALAAKALRLPLGIGGVNVSPYFSLTDLIKRWPQSPARREVLMVSDGIDRFYGSGDLQDPYLDEAIDNTLRAGIVVFAIYSPGAGHFGHAYWPNYWGQLYLSKLAEETSGEAYYIGFTGSPVSFSPYLEEMGRSLEHQYWVTFIVKPEKKSGWQKIKVMTEVPNAELISAHKVYVPTVAR